MNDKNVEVLKGSKRIRPQFRNFSTGIAFEDVTRKMDEEECYRKALQANV
ncbi:hypothetical protein F5883DRAFT_647051 [Diaporthe sp. PMI_573]|nr:hypothetical protein F5883DRAFT_647051 [Diaporthaceae sp. PMI_573]